MRAQRATPGKAKAPAGPDRLVVDDSWPDPGTLASPSARLLLRIALCLFAEHGYDATTTRDIATVADLSSAAVYTHFPSKAEVLLQIVRIGTEDALRALREGAASGEAPVERLRGAVASFTAWHIDNRMLARVTQYEARALDEEAQAEVLPVRRQIEREMRDLIKAGVADESLEVGDIGLATRAVLSLAVDTSRWWTGRYRRSAQEVGQEYGELVVRMIRSAPQPAASTR